MNKTCVFAPITFVGIFFLLFTSCSKDSSTSPSDTAAIKLLARIMSTTGHTAAGFSKSKETIWDSLVVRVSAADMATVRKSFPVDINNGLISETIENVNAGENRLIEAWTVNAAGDQIHGTASTIRSFEPGEIVSVQLLLEPIRGSIYIILTDLPTTVNTVYATFALSDGTTYETSAGRSTKVYMTLDNIVYGSTGTLVIAGLSESGDTIASWVREDFTFEKSNSTLEADFMKIGNLTVEISAAFSDVTVIRGIMDTTATLADERSGSDTALVISEIMYTSGSSGASRDYVEIYNAGDQDVTLDTFFIDLNGTTKTLVNVSIGAGDFFVVGHTAFPDSIRSKWGIDTVVSFDLVSTSSIISLKDKSGAILDWIAYENSDNSMGWPKLSSSAKTAVVLNSLSADPEYNNYGRNWSAAQSVITEGATTFYGTPGEAGL